MAELTGSLIEMNAHLYHCDIAISLIAAGCILIFASIFAILILHKNWKVHLNKIIAAIVVLALGLCGILYGYSLPKEKIIMACANGPISIERISSVYDVLDVDGKLLKLRVRP